LRGQLLPGFTSEVLSLCGGDGVSDGFSGWGLSRSALEPLRSDQKTSVRRAPTRSLSTWLVDASFSTGACLARWIAGQYQTRAVASLSGAAAAEDGAVTQTGASHVQLMDTVCPGKTGAAKNGDSWTYCDFEHLSVAACQVSTVAFTEVAHSAMTIRN
jgi:hypothetical protein